MPTPHSLTAAGTKSALSPTCAKSIFSNRPSSQPRTSSGDSTSSTSQVTLPASTMAFTLACSPLYSPATTLTPVALVKGA